MELSTQYVAFSESREANISVDANLRNSQPISETTFGATDAADGRDNPLSAGMSDSGRKTVPDDGVIFERAKILCLVVVIVILWGILLLPIVIYFIPSVSQDSHEIKLSIIIPH